MTTKAANGGPKGLEDQGTRLEKKLGGNRENIYQQSLTIF